MHLGKPYSLSHFTIEYSIQQKKYIITSIWFSFHSVFPNHIILRLIIIQILMVIINMNVFVDINITHILPVHVLFITIILNCLKWKSKRSAVNSSLVFIFLVIFKYTYLYSQHIILFRCRQLSHYRSRQYQHGRFWSLHSFYYDLYVQG